MLYPEYRRASKKHLLSCQCIIDNLDYCSTNEKHLLNTVYYLTGYTLETIFKYTIYAAIGYNKTKDIKTLDSNGLKYHDDIKIHSLCKLKRIIEGRQFSSITTYKNNKKLFDKWSSEDRYTGDASFTKTEIISFFELSKETFKSLQNYR
jgi:hypothetical protein